jgi:hypothetical protein
MIDKEEAMDCPQEMRAAEVCSANKSALRGEKATEKAADLRGER